MKIVVAIKQVPARDSQWRIASSGKWIEEADLSYEINEPDAYALEAGLQLKEAHGGEVVALCAGPERVAQTIREALAKGADRAIHIVEDDGPGMPGPYLDPLATARLLAAALRGEAPDLVLTGPQSDDLGFGQTGAILAELLGLPHATIVMQVEIQDGGIRVKRELEGGWFQHVEMPLPALLAIQSGFSTLRYATLMGIKKAKTKQVRRVTAADLGVLPLAASVTIERLYLPQRTKRTQLFEGTPQQAAAQLVEKLRFEARVI
jgi:electron transfer flavoprotein beta subunit